jgi:hypothetical protein
VLSVLGAVGAGVGALGWVAFIGGALLWIRADKAGLPAAEAVAVAPKSVLLAHGAEVATLAVAAAVLAVGVLYLADRFQGFRGALQLRAAKERELSLDEKVRAEEAAAEAARSNAAQGRAQAAELRRQAADEDDPGRQRRLLETAESHDALAVSESEGAAQAERTRDGAQKALETHRDRTRSQGRREWWLRIAVIGSILLVLPVGFIVVKPVSLGWVFVVLLIALFGTTLCFIVLTRERWIWFGVAAFLMISAVLTVAQFIRTRDDLKVEPAAVLRRDAGPICGFLVAQTSKYVYLGTYPRKLAVSGTGQQGTAGECTGATAPPDGVEVGSLPARLVAIPAEDATDVAVGPLLLLDGEGDADDAATRSAAMALDLCERRLKPRSASTTPKQAEQAAHTGCTTEELTRLRALAGG